MSNSFIVIGENVHTTRSFRKQGRRICQTSYGKEAIRYRTKNGEIRYLLIPEIVKDGQDYREGRIKHVQVALRHCMDKTDSAEEGQRYLETLIERQEEAGADFIDINVDEISLKLEEQQAAMRWLVMLSQQKSQLPLAIDSSHPDILAAGVESFINANTEAKLLINSASLDRLAAIELAVRYNTKIVVSASGHSRIPNNSEDRVSFATQIVEIALAKGIAANDIYVDPLIFPIAVDQSTGRHCLESITEIRKIYGGALHVTGGFSNVSFGLPKRLLINKVFIYLAIKAGADSGIFDPISNPIEEAISLDRSTKIYKLTEELLLGKDEFCATFIKSYRKGELSSSG